MSLDEGKADRHASLAMTGRMGSRSGSSGAFGLPLGEAGERSETDEEFPMPLIRPAGTFPAGKARFVRLSLGEAGEQSDTDEGFLMPLIRPAGTFPSGKAK